MASESHTFNQSNLRFFDKSGTELMLNYTSTIKIDVTNKDFPSCGLSYLLIPGTSGGYQNSSIIKTKDGSRFKQYDNYTVSVTIEDHDPIITEVPSGQFNITPYSSSKGYIDENGHVIGEVEFYIDFKYNELDDNHKRMFLEFIGIDPISDLSFEMASFEANLIFDKVSTELVETQSIFVLSETENQYENVFGIHGLVDVSTNAVENPAANNFMDDYNLFFFIDCRDQKDFRFFTIDGDSVVWSDRHIVDFTNGKLSLPDNGYRVDIGFRGELEGVYDQKMYVCLINKASMEVNVIGTINMTAETEGEDERYRTFFTNFGLPSIEEVDAAFRDSEINDDYPDYIARNKHAKKMFLAYSDIFPYAGSYKALANAMKFLGYDDVFFKEWYKDVSKPTKDDGGYVTYNISFEPNSKLNTINSKPIEERIHLRKMNWMSMMYKLNEEIYGETDRWGFPLTQGNINYYNTGNLMKLMSLKDWLDKYVVGVNCRITDVGGEGIVFERYNLYKFGQIQQIFDYTNEKQLSIKVNRETETLIDGSSNISIDINTSNKYDKFEDFEGKTFLDFTEGVFLLPNCEYIDDKKRFDLLNQDSTVYFGKTFELDNHMDVFDIRAKGSFSTFKFNNSEFIDREHPQLIIDNDKIFFDPRDITKKVKNSVFKNLPIIKIREGYLKRYDPEFYNEGYLCENMEIFPKVSDIAIYDKIREEWHYVEHESELMLVPPITYEDNLNIKYLIDSSTLVNSRSKQGPFSIVAEDEHEEKIDIAFDWITYGLRFTNDTFDGTPSFMIAGYTSPQFKDRFPFQNEEEGGKIYEYYMEILNGSMLFSDEENNRIVSVNFKFDGETRKIDITTFKSSRQSNIYEYKTSSTNYINRFTNGTTYKYFVKNYLNDAESVVFMNKTKSINVTNTGTYEIDTILYDEYNNVFCAKAKNTVNVVTPEIDTSTFICDSSFISDTKHFGVQIGNNNIPKIENITSYEDNKCIYEYVPKKRIFEQEEGNILRFIFDGSEFYRNQESFLYTQFNNLSDRFVFASRYRTKGVEVFSFIKRSFIDSDKGFVCIDNMEDVANTVHLQPNVTNIANPEDDHNYIDEILAEFSKVDSSMGINNQIGTLAGVNVVIYDDSCEYPLLSYPGVCLPTKNFENYNKYQTNVRYVNYEYRVIFDSVISDYDINMFIDLAEKPSSSIYIIPTWSLECDIIDKGTNNTVVGIEGYANLYYPFTKPLVVKDNYKLMNICKNDIPTSPYRSDIRWQDDEDPNYGQITPQNKILTNSFGQISSHLISKQEREYEGDSLWGRKINLDTVVSGNNEGKTFISHTAKTYSEFITKNDLKESNYKKGTFDIENTLTNKEMCYYLDTTYSVSFRNFNVRNGIIFWDDDNTSSLNKMYSYTIPVSTTKRNVMLAPILTQEFTTYENGFDILNEVDYTTSWKVYKHHNNSTHELLFECFNKILTLDLSEKGIYDVEMTIYDKHGNKFTRELIGAITIK